ncbi:hypothetical protein CEQ30_19875 [Nocardia brasiliensis]|nr:hypothetical protein CEQ30_19875 [Nocardia brasiliensis]
MNSFPKIAQEILPLGEVKKTESSASAVPVRAAVVKDDHRKQTLGCGHWRFPQRLAHTKIGC